MLSNFKIKNRKTSNIFFDNICLSIIITLEFFFKTEDIEIRSYFISYLFVFCHFIFVSFTDVIEKYLADYDFLNPLLILMSEGIFGFITTAFYSIFHNPFKELVIIYNEFETWKFILLIVLLILYFIFSLALNVYRILSNVLYSPMTKSLVTYFLNFTFIIYYFIAEKDFIIEGEKSYFYFIVNLILSVLIDFIALIYIEIIILKFCGLDKDTHERISYGANQKEIEMITNRIEDDDYFFNEDEKENFE